MKKYNTFFGYTFKEVIAFIMTVIITTVSKDIISVGFSKIIEYFPNIKAIITITINGYFFLGSNNYNYCYYINVKKE